MRADLIISTTGDWASECALNLLGRKDMKIPPIVLVGRNRTVVEGLR